MIQNRFRRHVRSVYHYAFCTLYLKFGSFAYIDGSFFRDLLYPAEIIEEQFERLVHTVAVENDDIERRLLPCFQVFQGFSLYGYGHRLIRLNRKSVHMIVRSLAVFIVPFVRFLRKIRANFETEDVRFGVCKYVFQKSAVDLDLGEARVLTDHQMKAFCSVRGKVQRHIDFFHFRERQRGSEVSVFKTELIAYDFEFTDTLARFGCDNHRIQSRKILQNLRGKLRARFPDLCLQGDIFSVEIDLFNSLRRYFKGIRLRDIICVLADIHPAEVIDIEGKTFVHRIDVYNYIL